VSSCLIRRALPLLGVAAVLAADCGGPPEPSVTSGAPSARTSTARAEPPEADVPPGAAYLVVEMPSGHELDRAHAEILDTPILPGSIAKIPLLAAALEAGVATPRTTLVCRRQGKGAGATLACVHPDLGRPLNAADALAHSCNTFFVALAERVPRSVLNQWRAAFGLPVLAASDSQVTGALGLAGPGVTPRAVVRLLPLIAEGGAALRDETRAALIRGLEGAATFGTASALADAGPGIMAKTGTAPMPGGGSEGIVVAFRPDGGAGDRAGAGLAVMVVAPGASGGDAAVIARELLRRQPASRADDRVRVGRASRGGYRVETLTLEDFVAHAVAGEADADAPPAALEAVAIVARTFARGRQGGHARDGFDACDRTHCLALREPGRAAREAARATRGQILVVGDRPARVWLSASCGGRTALAEEIWGGSASHLTSRDEPECRRTSHWQAEISADELGRALRAGGLRGELVRGLTVVARTSSGRVARVRVGGYDPPEMSAEDFRLAVGRTLGWGLIRSHAFEIARTAAGYRFVGTGFGHGVGLCVSGAARLAAEGNGAASILRAYFAGAHLAAGTATGAPWRLILPEFDERDRPALEGVIGRIVSDLGRRTGLDRPAGLTVRFHPTVESFRRATGRPWWVAGAASGGRVELLPAAVLRNRGALDATLRHELAHAFVDERLEERPLWVREGAALYFAGEATAEPPPASCPSDEEFLAAASAESMAGLYARAGACFAHEILAGRVWTEVGRPRDL
jgi:stage II sporulation protein D